MMALQIESERALSMDINSLHSLARLCPFFGDGKSWLRKPFVFKAGVFEHHIENLTFEKSRG